MWGGSAGVQCERLGRGSWSRSLPVDPEVLLDEIVTVFGVLDIDREAVGRTAADIVALPAIVELQRLAEMGATVEG